MSSQRVSSLKKKIAPQPKAPEEKVSAWVRWRSRVDKVYLYYADGDDFCTELIKILVQVPQLVELIKCINVHEWEVDKTITSYPTIDDGVKVIYVDENGEEYEDAPLFELENAFTWVMHRCYELCDEKLMTHKRITEIEMSIKKIFHLLQIQMTGPPKTIEVKKEHDRFKGTSDSNFVTFQNSGKLSVREAKLKAEKEATVKHKVKDSEVDLSQFQNERENVAEYFKNKWEKEGPRPSKTVNRESLKNLPRSGENDLEKAERDRQKIIDTNMKDGNAIIREPIKRIPLKMGGKRLGSK